MIWFVIIFNIEVSKRLCINSCERLLLLQSWINRRSSLQLLLAINLSSCILWIIMWSWSFFFHKQLKSLLLLLFLLLFNVNATQLVLVFLNLVKIYLHKRRNKLILLAFLFQTDSGIPKPISLLYLSAWIVNTDICVTSPCCFRSLLWSVWWLLHLIVLKPVISCLHFV